MQYIIIQLYTYFKKCPIDSYIQRKIVILYEIYRENWKRANT